MQKRFPGERIRNEKRQIDGHVTGKPAKQRIERDWSNNKLHKLESKIGGISRKTQDCSFK